MTPEKVLEVIGIYRDLFEKLGIGKIDYPHDDLLNNVPFYESDNETLAHCHGMLDRMVQFVHEGQMDKVFRWLGFIQGVLWSEGYYTLNELMDHNRPPVESL